MRFLNAPMRVVDQLAFSHDGERLFAAGTNSPAICLKADNRGLAVWNSSGPDPIDHLFPSNLIAGFAVNPAGRWLYFGTGYRYGDPPATSGYFAYDLRKQDLAHMGTRFGNDFMLDVHPSGGWLVGLGQAVGKRKTRLVRWSQPAKEPPAEVWERSSKSPASFVCQIACDPAGSRFVTLNVEGEGVLSQASVNLLVRDPASGATRERVAVPGRMIGRVLFSPDGAWLVVVNGPALIVYSARDLSREPLKTQAAGKKHITGVAFHPNSKYLAAASNDETVKFYDTKTWDVARTFTWNVGRMRSVAFSPDGTRAAVGSDTAKVVVFDVDM